MKKIIIGVMIVISFVFVLKISCVQAQNIMGDETSQEENCEQLNWTLENGILIISGQGKIPMDFFEDNSIDPDQPKELIIKRGITEPREHITFPYLVQQITVPPRFAATLAFAKITCSIIALEIPIALIGYAALSVDKHTTLFTPASIAA